MLTHQSIVCAKMGDEMGCSNRTSVRVEEISTKQSLVKLFMGQIGQTIIKRHVNDLKYEMHHQLNTNIERNLRNLVPGVFL